MSFYKELHIMYYGGAIMTTVYVYNKVADKVERFEKRDNEIMPYVYNNSLTVGQFKGSSISNAVWTDKKTMESWGRFSDIVGKPLYIGLGFKRIWEGGHSGQSPHYAGTALDIGHDLSTAERNKLRVTAINSGLWHYVEPAYLTPSWVHVDNRDKDPSCPKGYPILKQGDKGNYVLVLQDALNTIGYKAGLDGIFSQNVKNIIIDFQKANGLLSDGTVDCTAWAAITKQAVGIGIGKTSTVVKP